MSIFSSGWRKRFRRKMLLGHKPDGVIPNGLTGAESITLVKRDNIGDFILATTFLNHAHKLWQDKKVTLICRPQMQELAEAFYPNWTIKAPSDSRKDYRWIFLRSKPLKAEIEAWSESDFMLSLRAMRFQDEIVFDSWIPAKKKVVLDNQYKLYEPEMLKNGVPENLVYNEFIEVEAPALSAEVIAHDILNYRALLKYCFPREGVVENAWPVIPNNFLKDPRRAEAIRAQLNLGPSARFLAVFPFPSAEIRKYPEAKLVSVIESVARKYDLPVVILGGPADVVGAEKLLTQLQVPQPKMSLAGKLGIPELITCIAQASGLLSVESAGAHIAIAAGVPTVVIMGGGHYGQFGPWGPDSKARWIDHKMECYNCSWNCIHSRTLCIENIPPDELTRAFDCVMLDQKGTKLPTSCNAVQK